MARSARLPQATVPRLPPATSRMPRELIHGLRFDNLRGELYGGITAAVVALPRARGVASGAGPAAGLRGATLVAVFPALFGGAQGQVSGATGP